MLDFLRSLLRRQHAPMTLKPAGELQSLPDKWSPKVLLNGFGIAMVYIAKQTGIGAFEVENTNSMLPVFDAGHIIFAQPVKAVDLQEGDIIIYRDTKGIFGKPGETLVCHRFIRWAGDNLICKGDNNLYSDPPVEPHQVKHRVIAASYAR